MTTLDLLVYCAAAAALIAMPFFLINWIRYLKRRTTLKFNTSPFAGGFPSTSVMFFVVPLLIAAGLALLMASSSRNEALDFIGNLSGNYQVYVNNETASNPDKIISALKKTTPQPGHHSHPTKRIQLEIKSDRGNMTFELARDSAIPQEYWVFYSRYRLTSNYEIGRITTPLLDQYERNCWKKPPLISSLSRGFETFVPPTWE